MDYSELVKSLRICAIWKDEIRFPGKDGCNGCAYHDEERDVCTSWDTDELREHIMLDAADAIEELQATLCNWCAVCPEDKRDLSTCEIYESCRAKPPKEETE